MPGRTNAWRICAETTRRWALRGLTIGGSLVCTACGGGAPAHPSASSPPTANDTIAPSFRSITGALDGATLLGTAQLRAEAADDTGVLRTELAVDGAALHSASGPELACALDTQAYAPGAHKLLFSATDAAGNVGRRELRVTFVQGAGPAPPVPDPGTDAPPPVPGPTAPPPAPVTLPITASGTTSFGLPPLDVTHPPDPSDTHGPSSLLFASFANNQVVWDSVRCAVEGIDDKGVWYEEAWFGGQLVGSVTNDRGLDFQLDTNIAADGVRPLTIRVVDLGGNVAIGQLLLRVQNGIDHGRPEYMGGLDFDLPHLQGDVLLAPEVYEDRALALTTLCIDGEQVLSTVDQQPQYLWKTGAYADGVHQLAFVYTDTSNNVLHLFSYAEVANSPVTYQVTGRLYAPNGKDPLPGKWARIPKRAANNWLPFAYEHYSDLADGYYGTTTTDATGAFSITGVPPGARLLQLDQLQIPLSVKSNVALTRAQGTLPASGAGVPAITVVTGDGEALPDWLAKVGYGAVDAGGKLILGSEKFLLVDGNDSLPAGHYLDLPQYMNNPVLLNGTNILFIAAGTHYEAQLVASPAWREKLRSWRDAGNGYHCLYCGGNSYDYLEQAFPSAFNFGMAVASNEVPEPLDAVEMNPAVPGNMARLTFGHAASDTGIEIAWLHGMGLNSLQFNTDFALPLAAHWVGGPAWGGYDADRTILSCDYVYDPLHPNDRTMLLGCSGGLCFNGVPLPAAPHAQWSWQERLLECLLFTRFE